MYCVLSVEECCNPLVMSEVGEAGDIVLCMPAMSYSWDTLILHLEKLRPRRRNALIQFSVLSLPGLASPDH